MSREEVWKIISSEWNKWTITEYLNTYSVLYNEGRRTSSKLVLWFCFYTEESSRWWWKCLYCRCFIAVDNIWTSQGRKLTFDLCSWQLLPVLQYKLRFDSNNIVISCISMFHEVEELDNLKLSQKVVVHTLEYFWFSSHAIFSKAEKENEMEKKR